MREVGIGLVVCEGETLEGHSNTSHIRVLTLKQRMLGGYVQQGRAQCRLQCRLYIHPCRALPMNHFVVGD